MNKGQWKNYKTNNLKMIYSTADNGWIRELFDFPLINFLKKFKNPAKYHYKLMKLRFIFTQKPIIPNLEYVVTTRCTMNCRECNTFIPTLTKENAHINLVSFEQFKSDIDTLLKSVDYIQCFGFVGGEPLLNKDLAKMVKYACSRRKIHNVFIATNCTILPPDELVEAAKNKKVAFQISDYRNVENLKAGITVKYAEYKNILEENSIKFNNFQEKRGAITWFSMPECYKDRQEENKVEAIFKRCFGQYCNMLADGILMQCTLAIHVYRTKERTPEIEKDIVNIREKKSAKQLSDEIINFYARPYSEFCHWCHWENIKTELPCGEQAD